MVSRVAHIIKHDQSSCFIIFATLPLAIENSWAMHLERYNLTCIEIISYNDLGSSTCMVTLCRSEIQNKMVASKFSTVA